MLDAFTSDFARDWLRHFYRHDLESKTEPVREKLGTGPNLGSQAVDRTCSSSSCFDKTRTEFRLDFPMSNHEAYEMHLCIDAVRRYQKNDQYKRI